MLCKLGWKNSQSTYQRLLFFFTLCWANELEGNGREIQGLFNTLMAVWVVDVDHR